MLGAPLGRCVRTHDVNARKLAREALPQPFSGLRASGASNAKAADPEGLRQPCSVTAYGRLQSARYLSGASKMLFP